MASDPADPYSLSVQDHFRCMVPEDLRDESKYFTKRFLIQQNFFQKGGQFENTGERKVVRDRYPRKRLTLFDNGTVYFPYAMRHEVLLHMAHDAAAGTDTFWNPIAHDVEGEGCRLVLDVDSKNRIVNQAEAGKLAQLFQHTLKQYFRRFAEQPLPVFVARCGPRLNTKEQLGTGLHMHVSVKVSIEQAKQILHGFRCRMMADYRELCRGLEFDSDIYKEGCRQLSTRMIYSHKRYDCPLCHCKEARRLMCTFCRHDGKVISQSTYIPYLMVNGSGEILAGQAFDERYNDYQEVFRLYSIWAEPEDVRDDYEKPVNDEDYHLAEEEKKVSQKKRGAAVVTKPGLRAPRGRGRYNSLPGSHEGYALMEEFLRQIEWYGQRRWEGIEVRDISVSTTGRTILVDVGGNGSTVCCNAYKFNPETRVKDHEDNRIYFVIKVKDSGEMELEQRCHSKIEAYGCTDADRHTRFVIPRRLVMGLLGRRDEVPPSLYTSTRNVAAAGSSALVTFDQPCVADESVSANQPSRERDRYINHLASIYNLSGATEEDRIGGGSEYKIPTKRVGGWEGRGGKRARK